MYAKLGRCQIAVSEGVQDSQGRPIATTLVEGLDKDHQLLTKGAPEAISPRCAFFELDGEIFAMEPLVEGDLMAQLERVEAERVAMQQMRVDHRREQVVRGTDGVHVAGEVEVDVLHRHDLRVAAAGSTPLHAEAWPE